jgi:hypothetical protein
VTPLGVHLVLYLVRLAIEGEIRAETLRRIYNVLRIYIWAMAA